MSIYERVGGNDVVKTAVSVLYVRVTNDPTLAAWFDGVDMTRLKAHQRAFLTAALDGPQVFTGLDLGAAHHDMAITDAAFTSVTTHLLVTLADLGVAPGVVDQVEGRLESLRPLVVQA
jgi:hemoglobin